MLWKYRVVKNNSKYYVTQVYYGDYQESDIDTFDDNNILAVDDSPELVVDSSMIYHREEEHCNEDTESIRALVVMLYEIIDDIKKEKAIDINTINDNLTKH